MAQHPDILRLVSSSRMIVLLVHRPLYVLMFTFLSSKILPYTIRFDAFHNGIRQIEVHTVPFEIRIVCFGLKAFRKRFLHIVGKIFLRGYKPKCVINTTFAFKISVAKFNIIRHSHISFFDVIYI